MDALTDLLLRQEHLYLMAGVWVVVQMFTQFLPPKISNHPVSIRLRPLFAIVLCSAGIWIPGITPPDTKVGSVILIGLILGYAVSHSHKLITQSLLGRDNRITSLSDAPKPEHVPADEASAEVPTDKVEDK